MAIAVAALIRHAAEEVGGDMRQRGPLSPPEGPPLFFARPHDIYDFTPPNNNLFTPRKETGFVAALTPTFVSLDLSLDAVEVYRHQESLQQQQPPPQQQSQQQSTSTDKSSLDVPLLPPLPLPPLRHPHLFKEGR
jgi:hypothetical protein